MPRPLLLLAVLCALPASAAEPADARPPGLDGANWQFGPLNRWAYTHLREVLPTKAIPRDSQRLEPIPGLDAVADRIELELGGETVSLATAMDRHYVDGVLVLQDGRAVLERYAGTLTPERPHLLWSVSKTITGLVAASVAADGLVDLDRPVAHYVPELAESGWGPDPLRALLDMRDGSAWTEDYAAPDSTVRRQDCADGLLAGPDCAGIPVTGNYPFLRTVPRDPDRVGTFVYKSGTTDVVAWVLEAATGRRFADLVAERLWKPIGAERDASITVDVSGFTLASGGVSATLRDVARVGQLMLDRGRVGDRQVVPATWIDDLVAQDSGAPWYRSFVWGLGDGRCTFQARGVHGQFVHVAPATGTVIALLSSWPDADGGVEGVGEGETIALLDALERAVQ